MIDTLKLLIPIQEIELVEKLEGNLTRFRKEDLKKGETIFEFHSSNVELGSYRRNVMIKSTRNPLGIFIELSFAKYAKGNNVEMIHAHELPAVAEKLYTELCQHLDYALPPINTWPVYRLDVCYNWLLKNHDDAVYAMDFIQRIDYPRKKKHTWNTSVMYVGTEYTIKFYLKGDEFLKHDFKEIGNVNEDRAYELQQWAKRILRFEVGLRRTYLNQFLGLKDTFISDISDDAVILDTLNHYLDRVFFYINPTSTSEAEVIDILRRNYSKTKAMNLFVFYKGYFFDQKIKGMYEGGGLDRSTIYRHKKALKALGIGHDLSAHDGKGILEQLVIPSLATLFDLPNLGANDSMQP